MQTAAAIAQIVYTLLTLVLVFYAVRQLRETNRERRVSRYQAALAMMFDWRSDIIAHPDLAERMADQEHGSPYFQEVVGKHKALPYFHTVKLFNIFECLHIMYREKVITAEMWRGWEANLALVLTGKETVEIWGRLKKAGIFANSFASLVDELLTARQRSSEGQHLAEAPPPA